MSEKAGLSRFEDIATVGARVTPTQRADLAQQIAQSLQDFSWTSIWESMFHQVATSGIGITAVTRACLLDIPEDVSARMVFDHIVARVEREAKNAGNGGKLGVIGDFRSRGKQTEMRFIIFAKG
jgi:hypothetical protein